jgi:hypothetical protein
MLNARRKRAQNNVFRKIRLEIFKIITDSSTPDESHFQTQTNIDDKPPLLEPVSFPKANSESQLLKPTIQLPETLEPRNELVHTPELSSVPLSESGHEMKAVTYEELQQMMQEEAWPKVRAVELLFHDSQRFRFAFEQGLF